MKHLMVLALLFFSNFLHAWTLSSSYTKQRGWAQRPLVFHVNRTNCPSDLDDYIQEAMDLWNSVPESSLKLELGSDTTNTIAQLWAGTASDVPMIACDSNFSVTTSVDGNSIPGVGFLRGTAIDPVENGGLLLNVEAGKTANINSLSRTMVSVVVAHEIGHVLGIGHTSDTSALMYYDATAKKSLSLSQDDRDAVMFLYPRNELTHPALIGGCGMIKAIGSDDDLPPWASFLGGNSLLLLLSLWALLIFFKSRGSQSSFSS